MTNSLDLKELQNSEHREAFFADALSSRDALLESMVAFYEATKEAMVDSGFFDEAEATKEAAVASCRGLARAIRQGSSIYGINSLDAADKFIRKVHNIRQVDYPRNHDDPLVAAFYEELEPHLLKAMPGDRADTWQR